MIGIKVLVTLVLVIVTLSIALWIVGGPLAGYGRRTEKAYETLPEEMKKYLTGEKNCSSFSKGTINKRDLAFLACLHYYGVCGYGKDNAVNFTWEPVTGSETTLKVTELRDEIEKVCAVHLCTISDIPCFKKHSIVGAQIEAGNQNWIWTQHLAPGTTLESIKIHICENKPGPTYVITG